MRVLSVTSEIYPLIKTGGLADVAGALPPALAGHGVEMRSLIPGYPAVMEKLDKVGVLREPYDVLGARARLLEARVAGLDLVVIDAPALYDRPGGPYNDPGGGDHADNWRRFGALSRAGADIGAGLLADFRPDIVHAHDWQAAMTPAYLRYDGVELPSVVTVHNLAFQGQFPASVLGPLGLPESALTLDGVEYFGGVGFLKAGLQSAWAVTTVSPTYAAEIMTPAYGMGLDGLIAQRADTVFGIVNGIDTQIWDPETDKSLAKTFSARRLATRKANRKALEARFELEPDPGPIFVMIGRLTWQKGMDLLAAAGDALVAAGARLALLGSGDAALEGQFLALAGRHRGRIGVVIGYDEALAHLMQGGGDAILVPSRFEPCGLTQLCGLRYGCVPVVARTGGLADTVIDANTAALAAGVATGFQFAPNDTGAMIGAFRRAVAAFHQPKLWAGIQRQGMKADVSWTRSAGEYAALYRDLAKAGAAP